MKKKMIFIFLAIILFFMGTKIFTTRSYIDKNIDIVVDSGHGGNDPGTMTRDGIYEKDINLEISRRLSSELERKGYNVILTRDDDSKLKSMDRVHLANDKGAKLLLSIHCNATEDNNSINGVQVLYFPSESSKNISEILLESILNKTKANDMGIVERRDLIVLNQTSMPAVIVETGFLTNDKEANLLQKNSYQKKIVEGIVEGVDSYFYTLGR